MTRLEREAKVLNGFCESQVYCYMCFIYFCFARCQFRFVKVAVEIHSSGVAQEIGFCLDLSYFLHHNGNLTSQVCMAADVSGRSGA